jgi:hypothetical protein
MDKLSIKNYRFMCVISFILGIMGVVLFFIPINQVLPYIKKYDNVYEAKIFFISFFAENKFFLMHAFAVLMSFLAFLVAILSLLREKGRGGLAILAIMVSFIVIFAYILGYDMIFQIIDWFGVINFTNMEAA